MITPVVGFTDTVPFVGPPITATEPGFKVVSMSLSLFRTEIASGLSSIVVTLSFTAFGASFLGVTVIGTITVSQAPAWSQTITQSVS